MDITRRNFLKIMLIGGGSFIAGKVFGPIFSKLSNSQFDSFSNNTFNNFRIVENQKGLVVYDKSGTEVFTISQKT